MLLFQYICIHKENGSRGNLQLTFVCCKRKTEMENDKR